MGTWTLESRTLSPLQRTPQSFFIGVPLALHASDYAWWAILFIHAYMCCFIFLLFIWPMPSAAGDSEAISMLT